MFSRSSSPRQVMTLMLLAIAALTLAGLAGCGGKKEVDPYVYTTLNRVMDGDTLSTNFLFEIDAPAIDYVDGDVAIVRNGNRLEFLVGPDLENNYANYAGMLLGVEKRFSPTSHLFLMRTKQGEIVTPVDSLESYTLPIIFQATQQQIETPGAPLPDLKWNKKSEVEALMPENEGDPLIKVQSGIANFVYAPRHDLEGEAAEAPGEGDYAWYAVFPESTFEIVDVEPGADYMLKLLKAKNLPLVGSFSISAFYDKYTDRVKTYGDLGHVIGQMKINWFRYANNFVRAAI